MNEQMNMCPFCGNSIRSGDNATHCPVCREINRMRDRIAELEQKLAAALERWKVMETALREIVRMSTPDRVCVNCAHCEEVSGDDYCSLVRHCKKLEDASSQTCDHFRTAGFIVPGTCKVAGEALSAAQPTAPKCDAGDGACKGCAEVEK